MTALQKSRFDIHETITRKIITAIEAGVDEWKMPWHRPGTSFSIPRNATTDKCYRGINILSLWIDADDTLWENNVYFERAFALRRDDFMQVLLACYRARAGRATEAREQWTQQKHRSTQTPDQRAVGLVLRHAGTAHAKRRGPNPVDSGPHVDQQSRHDLDVADARHVGQHTFFGRQEARGQQGERRVLVAFHFYDAGQSSSAFNQQCRHRDLRL